MYGRCVTNTFSVALFLLYQLSTTIFIFRVHGTSHYMPVLLLFSVVTQQTPVVNGYRVNYSAQSPCILTCCIIFSLVPCSTHSPILITLLNLPSPRKWSTGVQGLLLLRTEKIHTDTDRPLDSDGEYVNILSLMLTYTLMPTFVYG